MDEGERGRAGGRDIARIEDWLARGDRGLARAISLIENEGDGWRDLVRALYPRTGHAYVLGVTGPPGCGKSTLVDQLIRLIRQTGQTVGVLAVDPSSPFSGGALLGDRVRMQEHAGDPGVFIRSMASRRSLGGLAAATRDAVRVLDAFGKDIVILETVGVGQIELDIVKAADTTLAVLIPGLGDGIQMIKAGLMEIADLFVVNMADREGVRRTVTDLKQTLTLAAPRDGWRPPVAQTVALTGQGVPDLWAAIERHRAYLAEENRLARRRAERDTTEALEAVERALLLSLRRDLARDPTVAGVLREVQERRRDPAAAAETILREHWRVGNSGGD